MLTSAQDYANGQLIKETITQYEREDRPQKQITRDYTKGEETSENLERMRDKPAAKLTHIGGQWRTEKQAAQWLEDVTKQQEKQEAQKDDTRNIHTVTSRGITSVLDRDDSRKNLNAGRSGNNTLPDVERTEESASKATKQDVNIYQTIQNIKESNRRLERLGLKPRTVPTYSELKDKIERPTPKEQFAERFIKAIPKFGGKVIKGIWNAPAYPAAKYAYWENPTWTDLNVLKASIFHSRGSHCCHAVCPAVCNAVCRAV